MNMTESNRMKWGLNQNESSTISLLPLSSLHSRFYPRSLTSHLVFLSFFLSSIARTGTLSSVVVYSCCPCWGTFLFPSSSLSSSHTMSLFHILFSPFAYYFTFVYFFIECLQNRNLFSYLYTRKKAKIYHYNLKGIGKFSFSLLYFWSLGLVFLSNPQK